MECILLAMPQMELPRVYLLPLDASVEEQPTAVAAEMTGPDEAQEQP